jgi:hypothetical protein
MRADQRIVTRLPLEELWSGSGLMSTIKVRDLNAEQIRELLRSAEVRLVVADVGVPLRWIPNNETYDFWKQECRHRLADPDSRAGLEDFPGEYCYFASEWKSDEGEKIIVLSKMH